MTKALIVGLGNPGPQYENTRHNIGFTMLEALARHAGIIGKQEKRFEAIVGTGRLGMHSLILAQPLTYMNLSGQAVQKLLHYYDVPVERLLVVYDEAALPFGRLRFRPNGSDAGQKGMRSIQQSLGGRQDIPRLRVGIGLPMPPMSMADYVLARFSTEERDALPKLIDTVVSAIQLWLEADMLTAMERYNGPATPKVKPEKPPLSPLETESQVLNDSISDL
jgi:PTH1 family peptidyl-tRNA hydrolase